MQRGKNTQKLDKTIQHSNTQNLDLQSYFYKCDLNDINKLIFYVNDTLYYIYEVFKYFI